MKTKVDADKNQQIDRASVASEAPDLVSGHTPGPWKVHEPLECKGRCGYPHNRTVVVHRDYEILVADCGTRSKVAKANAHLIAAAPELLELIKGSLSHLEERVVHISAATPAEDWAMERAMSAAWIRDELARLGIDIDSVNTPEREAETTTRNASAGCS